MTKAIPDAEALHLATLALEFDETLSDQCFELDPEAAILGPVADRVEDAANAVAAHFKLPLDRALRIILVTVLQRKD